MSEEQIKFIQGLHAQLKKIGMETKRKTDSIILLYIQERFLFRLSLSKYRDSFLLKGGLLIYADTKFKGRPTRDIDLLAQQISSELGTIESIFREICQVPVRDGVYYDADHLSAKRRRIDNDAVISVKVTGDLGRSPGVVNIDLSFQGVVSPASQDISFPVLLEGQGTPKLKAYSLESAIAEKFQAMIFRAGENSRMKDFYDIYTFANGHSFDGQVLLIAIQETFHQRKTSMEEIHILFSPEFAREPKRVTEWDAFLKREGIEPISFDVVMEKITVFLKPIYDSLFQGVEYHSEWNPSASRWES